MVVGLGNPGRKYENTRHNIGFMVAEHLRTQYGGVSVSRQFEGQWAQLRIENTIVAVLQPHTFMNASGQSVRQAFDFYKLSFDDLLVVCDDLNLPSGRVRLKRGGSSGGQKGLADILRHLGTDQWARLKIGIDRPPEHWQVVDYVLGQFDSHERVVMERSIDRACRMVRCWALQGVTAAMNEYNAQPDA